MKLLFPASPEEAAALCRETDGAFIAGGTVLMADRHRGKPMPETLVSLDKLDALRHISFKDGILTVGAIATMDDIENSAPVKTHAAALWAAAREVGGPQVRNRATLGGNAAKASPASDCAAPLLALGARMNLLTAEGVKAVPVRTFFSGYPKTALKPGELILSFTMDVSGVTASAFHKAGKRSAMVVSTATLAVARHRDGSVSVAAGSAAPHPVYCEKTSALLSRDASALTEAGALIQTEISPIDDRWGTASYRRTVIRNMLYELIETTETAK